MRITVWPRQYGKVAMTNAFYSGDFSKLTDHCLETVIYWLEDDLMHDSCSAANRDKLLVLLQKARQEKETRDATAQA